MFRWKCTAVVRIVNFYLVSIVLLVRLSTTLRGKVTTQTNHILLMNVDGKLARNIAACRGRTTSIVLFGDAWWLNLLYPTTFLNEHLKSYSVVTIYRTKTTRILYFYDFIAIQSGISPCLRFSSHFSPPKRHCSTGAYTSPNSAPSDSTFLQLSRNIRTPPKITQEP